MRTIAAVILLLAASAAAQEQPAVLFHWDGATDHYEIDSADPVDSGVLPFNYEGPQATRTTNDELARPVLLLGNSDAYMAGQDFPSTFPGLPYLVRSYYSRPCAYIKSFFPFVAAWYQATYGGPPPAIVNYEGQCDAEQGNSPAAFLSCAEGLSAMEAAAWPQSPQIWVNVAPEPSYVIGPPSYYPGNIWALVMVYNVMLGQLPQRAGGQVQVVDVYGLTVAGRWGDPAYFTYPSVDLNPAGEAVTNREALAPILCQYVRCQ